MSCLRFTIAVLSFVVLAAAPLRAQLIINEVSNGPTGSQEYVELLVIGTPSCTNSCVDLRGWILDDNNGYFASGAGTGIAAGHMRFASNSTWQCVPIGTIIVIYNEGDRNPSIPADNLTGANCRYILPASSTLFEKNIATPVVSGTQTYGGPYTAGGAWGTQGLSNSDDTYQVRDPSNLTVPYHAVGYGNNSTNAIIYFAGAGGQTVYSMLNTTSNDPFLQSNWVKGVSPTNETPGAPNNTANATWINTLNNNCTPVTTGVNVDLGPDVTICIGDSITIKATVSAPGGTFTWNGVPSGTVDSIRISPAATTNVIVNYTLSPGCTDADTIVVNILPQPNGSILGNTTICAGQSTTLTATGAANFLWSTTETSTAITVSPLTTTVYSVTITGPNGCKDTVTTTVTVNGQPIGSIAGNTTVCAGTSTTLTASGGTSYVWSTTDITPAISVAPTTNTTYTVTVTDGNGCKDTVATLVTANAVPNGAITGTTAICSGASTTLTASGGTSYVWSTTDVTPAITVSPTVDTNYSVTVTDGNGCKDTVTTTVTVGTAVVGAIAGNLTICNGQSTTLTASGGSTYLWSTTAITAAITVSPTSTTVYSVTVSSGPLCRDTVTVTVNVNPNPIASITGNTTICAGDSTTLTASGGTSYLWNTSAVTPAITVSPISTTNYNVTVTDGNGCIGVGISTVTVNTAPNANAGTNQTICDGNTVSLTATGGGTYAWSTAATTASISVSPTTTTDYIVTVTTNGCTDADTVTVTVNPNTIVLAVDSIAPETCNLGNGLIVLQSPSNFVTYILSQGGVAIDTAFGGGIFFDLDAGTYDITATDNNGCQRNITGVIVPSITAPPFTVAATMPLCFGNNNGSIVLTGASSLTYSVNGGVPQSSGSFTGLSAGDYTFTVGDNVSGCDTTVIVTLTQPDVLIASIAPDSVNIITGNAIDLVSTTLGGSVPYSYLWSPATGLDCDSCATVSAAPIDSLNIYTLTVTDVNGCVDTARVVVRVSNEFLITVPSGFTPNGDGWNDFLRPLSNEPINFHLMVFNRWGEKIFEADNLPGWDGTYKHEPQPLGTYAYVIEYTRLLTGKKGYLTGNITLLR